MEQSEVPWWQRLITLNPALVRGLVVTTFGLVAAVLNVTVLPDMVETIITFVLALFGILTAILIKPAVTPNAKVVVYDDTPLSDEATILPGEAIALPTDMYQVEKAARRSGLDDLGDAA